MLADLARTLRESVLNLAHAPKGRVSAVSVRGLRVLVDDAVECPRRRFGRAGRLALFSPAFLPYYPPLPLNWSLFEGQVSPAGVRRAHFESASTCDF